ncbi:hypothetical protein AS594_39420 [Streptomyces agglomeratus]|uniref:Uncharacterized protein n=1 Tax=Streptomyces agglomeratus TaxID=285458 RepID=A0A1E5NZ55_9ACTN|nr:hypothetical protein AS594_39420 [Streptomyces agglomeratus]
MRSGCAARTYGQAAADERPKSLMSWTGSAVCLASSRIRSARRRLACRPIRLRGLLMALECALGWLSSAEVCAVIRR